jgi:hypothetical protein
MEVLANLGIITWVQKFNMASCYKVLFVSSLAKVCVY